MLIFLSGAAAFGNELPFVLDDIITTLLLVRLHAGSSPASFTRLTRRTSYQRREETWASIAEHGDPLADVRVVCSLLQDVAMVTILTPSAAKQRAAGTCSAVPLTSWGVSSPPTQPPRSACQDASFLHYITSTVA